MKNILIKFKKFPIYYEVRGLPIHKLSSNEKSVQNTKILKGTYNISMSYYSF